MKQTMARCPQIPNSHRGGMRENPPSSRKAFREIDGEFSRGLKIANIKAVTRTAEITVLIPVAVTIHLIDRIECTYLD